MRKHFVIDTDQPPALGPISKRWEWCCENGCGKCDAVLVEFRTYHSTCNGYTDAQHTEPRLVSSCCGEAMFLWDSEQDNEGPTGFDGTLKSPRAAGAQKEGRPNA